jgi:two-component system, cell cycle response regulator
MDGVVRYGGDEFVLYFPETPLEAGSAICQRILNRVRAQRWEAIEPGLAVSLSIGLAATRGIDSVAELLEAADGRLRAAKQAGKNRVNAGLAEPALSNVA